MADTNIHHNYSFADIERYVSGSMTAKEMHDIERAALQDPFLADAIEGYQKADKKITEIHLNEIVAAIQGNKSETKIITLPKRKSYGWQIAASLIIIVSAVVLFFTKQASEKTSAPLASNDIKKEEKTDSFTKDKDAEMSYQKPDSLSSALSNTEAFSKRQNGDINKNSVAEKKEEPVADITALAAPSKKPETTLLSSAPAASEAFNDKAITKQQQPQIPTAADTMSNLSEVVVTRSAKREAKSAASMWTTDKGKPFILSEVEEINLGKKSRKITDTSAIKPEGGWQSFRDYLFSKLSKKDTASFSNDTHFTGSLELEFSFETAGLPYNIKVLNTGDSAIIKMATNALRQGPKWTTNDMKQKRLRIRY